MENRERVVSVCFSPTDTTRKIVSNIAAGIATALRIPSTTIDITLPRSRKDALVFLASDIVVFGTPVYAGRVPNVLLKFMETIEGNGALSVPVVVFGNRDYDDALIELRDILEKAGLRSLAAGAFVGEHSFSTVLAEGRPDQKDIQLVKDFALKVTEKYIKHEGVFGEVPVKGSPYPYRGYYQPRDRHGNAVDIRKVKPLTNEKCNDCKVCVEVCPMGSISYDNVREFTGICIKCGACVKKCPVQAKYYDDAGYLYHQNELEEGFKARREPELFL